MPKRTVEQTLRDELAAAEKEVASTKAKNEAARLAVVAATDKKKGTQLAYEAAQQRRSRAQSMLEIHTGNKVEEVSDDEPAVPQP